MQKDKSFKVKSTTHSQSASKRSLEQGMLRPAQYALIPAQPLAKLTLPLKDKDSSKHIARLSVAIEILHEFETIAEGTKIPGLSCPFRVLIKILTLIKNMKENNNDAQYLFTLCEKHLRVALDSVWQDGDPLSSFSGIFKYFVDTLLEVNDSTSKIKNRTPTAALRFALSDKQEMQDFTQKLNDGLLLFVSSSVSETEARRSKYEDQRKREMDISLNRLETKMDEIMSRLERICAQLDESQQRSCQQPLEHAHQTLTRSSVTKTFVVDDLTSVQYLYHGASITSIWERGRYICGLDRSK